MCRGHRLVCDRPSRPEEINPYDLFQTASLYTGRIINPAQTRAVVQTAIRTAIAENGPTVLAIPGDVAARPFEDSVEQVTLRQPMLRPVTRICASWPS